MVEEIIGGLVVAAVLAIAGWVWHRRSVLPLWFRREQEAADQATRETEADRVTVLREQVLEVARALGEILPASATGHSPTIVTYSDGTQSYFFPDFAAYRRALEGGQAPPNRSFPQRPPLPVSKWDPARLEQWLSDHAH